jgi:hypothetical protein
MTRLRAAAGAVPLRPVVGSRLTGFAVRLEPSIGIHDQLMAKVLLLDDWQTRLLWIACDLIAWSPEDDAALRRLAANSVGTHPDHVLVSCTHTHSGPSSMSFRGPLNEVDTHWRASVFDAIAREGGDLVPRLQPARVGHASETVTGIGYNRQDEVSPIDPRLLVMQLRGEDGQVIATILNYATHPVVLGDRNLLFSADYPGYATRLIEATVGGAALFIQGAAGDVNPFIFRDHPREAGTFEVAEQMGHALASVATRALESSSWQSDVLLRIATQRVELPMTPAPSNAALSDLRAELLAHRGPPQRIPSTAEGRWAMFELAWVEELQQAMANQAVPRTLSIQLTAARIGELVVAAFPLEVYSQIALDLRQYFDPSPMIIAGYTNGLYGYAPTDRAINQGGYGPGTSHRFFPHLLTPLGLGTDQKLVSAATELIRGLEPTDPR